MLPVIPRVPSPGTGPGGGDVFVGWGIGVAVGGGLVGKGTGVLVGGGVSVGTGVSVATGVAVGSVVAGEVGLGGGPSLVVLLPVSNVSCVGSGCGFRMALAVDVAAMA